MLRAELLGNTRAEDGTVVVAQVRAEPGQTTDEPAHRDRERQDEENLSVGIPDEDDGRHRARLRADVLLPLRQPIECLEHRAVGLALEGAPERLDRAEVMENLDADIAGRQGRRRCAIAPGRPEALVDGKEIGKPGTLAYGEIDFGHSNGRRLIEKCPGAVLQPKLNKWCISARPDRSNSMLNRPCRYVTGLCNC